MITIKIPKKMIHQFALELNNTIPTQYELENKGRAFKNYGRIQVQFKRVSVYSKLFKDTSIAHVNSNGKNVEGSLQKVLT